VALPPAHGFAVPDVSVIGASSDGDRAVTRRVLRIAGLVLVAALVAGASVPLTRTVELSGYFAAERVVPIRPQISGQVAGVFVSAGDTVEAGQLLALLDGYDLSAERAQLLAQRARIDAETRAARTRHYEDRQRRAQRTAAAQARLTAARAAYRRTAVEFGFAEHDTEQLPEGVHVALDEARSGVAVAEALLSEATHGVEQSHLAEQAVRDAERAALTARLDALDGRLERLSMVVPATLPDGGIVITEELADAIGRHLARGEKLMDVAALERFQFGRHVALIVRARASESDAHKLRPGLPARITVPALPGDQPRQLGGRVVRIAPAASADGSGGYVVEVAVDAPSLRALRSSGGSYASPVRSGFSAEIAAQTKRETLLAGFFRSFRHVAS
jgi:multidrug efflux pump subunit AcrA (membrane-fusion protein)